MMGPIEIDPYFNLLFNDRARGNIKTYIMLESYKASFVLIF
jgi:hypothetical protein